MVESINYGKKSAYSGENVPLIFSCKQRRFSKLDFKDNSNYMKLHTANFDENRYDNENSDGAQSSLISSSSGRLDLEKYAPLPKPQDTWATPQPRDKKIVHLDKTYSCTKDDS